MQIYIDNFLIRKITENEISEETLLKACDDTKLLNQNERFQVVFNWINLLEVLNFGNVFEAMPKFDEQNELFNFITLNLTENADKNLIMDLYDQLFAQVLTDVKSLKEVNASLLIQAINDKGFKSGRLMGDSLASVEKILSDVPREAMHDLILYLGFDRMSVAVAELFEKPSANKNSLEVLRDCLIESFQHITAEGRTRPSFFRLIEALYAFDMRDEILDGHSEADWTTLCKSSKALSDRNSLVNVPYVDAALVRSKTQETEDVSIVAITLDSNEKTGTTLSLANYMIQKLKRDVPDWSYELTPITIISPNL
jgi:hypothetical protein